MRFIKTFDGLFEGDGQSKFGCAMASLKMPLMSALQSVIDPDDLSEDGLESDPHVTLLYGLHDDTDIESVFTILFNVTPGLVSLGPVSMFENDDFDVLKFDASAEWLFAANTALSKLPHTNKYKDYKPHVTLAYVKPGMGQKYVDMFAGLSYSVTPVDLVYSDADHNKTNRPLNAN